MSFSAGVKRELCRQGLSRRCCAQAEAYGVLLFCNTFHSGELRIITESDAWKARLPQLFKKAFRLSFDRLAPLEPGKGTFLITDREKLKIIYDVYGLDVNSGPSLHINFAVLEEPCCQSAFFRGAFLAGGSVTDPLKSYHLEIVSSHLHVSREAPALLREMGFAPKSTTRKANHITYFKQSDHIEDFLTTIGAPVAAMEIMNSKLERDLRGKVNRRVNCDNANLDKAVAAAQHQIDAIRTLREQGMLAALPDKLKETADLRLELPELTLSELAEAFVPPISKSALNHRLRKLVELAGAVNSAGEDTEG